MIKLLQSKWMCVLAGAIMYLGMTVALWKSPKPSPRVTTVAAAKPTDAPKPSWEFHSAEADELITDLLTQKQVQTERARKLDELEARLKAERYEIATVVQSVKQQQDEFDHSVVRVHEEEVINLKRLAKIYAAMSPEGAVSILRELKDDDVVKIFAFMKDGETAPILESLAHQGQAEAKRAAQISDRLKVCLSRNLTEKKSS
jgi:flagellar motility protein MotE (MotC chaperone)